TRGTRSPTPSATLRPRLLRSAPCGDSTATLRLSLKALDDGHVGLSSAFAHGLQAVPPTGALELVQERRHEAGAGGTERVPERDRAAVDVHLRGVGPCVLHPGKHDGRKRLVDLDEVDV